MRKPVPPGPAGAFADRGLYETDPARGFARGFAIQTIGPLPISFARHMAAANDAWGWGMRRLMMDYNHWMALGVLGEVLPWNELRRARRAQIAGRRRSLAEPRLHPELGPRHAQQKRGMFATG